jgi:tetratricopeptide (TPR) repeat protein
MRSLQMARAIVILVLGLGGCASSYREGKSALVENRYDEAAVHFADTLARNPDRLDALAGLGISKLKLGALDESVDVLQRVVARAPRQGEARLYLGVAFLQTGDLAAAEAHLATLRDQQPEPRLAAQVDRALSLMRGEPLTDEVRRFVASSLEAEADSAREMREMRLALRDAELRRYFYDRPVYICRGRRC